MVFTFGSLTGLLQANAGALSAALAINIPNASTITLNTTVDQAITVTITWGVANASNTITLRQMIVEIIR